MRSLLKQPDHVFIRSDQRPGFGATPSRATTPEPNKSLKGLCGAQPPHKPCWTNAVVLVEWSGTVGTGAGERSRWSARYVHSLDGIFTQHVWPQNQLPAPRVHPRIGGDFSWRYGFLSLTLRATNAVFFADFAPPKASKPLIRRVYFGNGRDMPRPQHSRPGRQFREGPWRHRKSRQKASTGAINRDVGPSLTSANQINGDRCPRCAA